MGKVKVISINENVFANNIKAADLIRKQLAAQGTLFINFMSSPGSGKTTVLSRLIKDLKDRYTIGEMDVDIKSSLDAEKVSGATGIRTMQINNNGLCHIDADMTARAMAAYDVKGLDLLFLENIGNLVCPAEFDTGAHVNVMILSVPEGDDKPLKYPLMFTKCDLVLINKVDTLDYFDFNMEVAKERIKKLNPSAEIMEISGKTGQGMEKLENWFIQKTAKLKGEAYVI